MQPVEYAALDFLDKNRDTFFPDLTSCAASSEVALMQTLFPQSEADDADATHSGTGRSFASVSHKFTLSLSALLAELGATDASFIRTIKPNDALAPGTFDAPNVLTQLRTCGMVQAVKMMRAMYPSRIDLADISARYRHRLPKFMQTMDDRAFVSAICAAFDVDADDYALGNSRLFFKAGKAIFLNKLCRQAAAGAEGAAEVIVLNWKLGQWQREYRAAQMVRAWVHRARKGKGDAGAPTVEQVHAYRRVRRAYVIEQVEKRAATRMQKHARMLVEGKAFRRRKAAVLLMQTRSRGRAARVYVPQHRQQLKEQKAATAIQRRHRGGVVKARYGAERKKVTLVAATWRGYAARTRYQSWQENGRVGILKAQSAARGLKPRRELRRRARAAAQQIESTWKMVRVARLAKQLAQAAAELKHGAVLEKYREGGSHERHQRKVWVSDDLQILYWSRVPDAAAETAKALAESGGGAAAPAAAPAKKSMFGGSKDGEVKSLSMAMVSAVSAGLKTGMMKKMEERSKGFMGISLTAKSLKPLELNPDCAFSVLSQERTLDFVAANPEERDRWLKNLRLVLVHARTYDGFGGGGAAMALMKQAAQNAQPAGPLSPGMRRAERTKTFAFGKNAGDAEVDRLRAMTRTASDSLRRNSVDESGKPPRRATVEGASPGRAAAVAPPAARRAGSATGVLGVRRGSKPNYLKHLPAAKGTPAERRQSALGPAQS